MVSALGWALGLGFRALPYGSTYRIAGYLGFLSDSSTGVGEVRHSWVLGPWGKELTLNSISGLEFTRV